MINPDSLTLRHEIRNKVEIQFSDIEKIVLFKVKIKQDNIKRKLSPLENIENHNAIIHINKENTLIGLYGLQKGFRVLAYMLTKP